MYKLGLLRLSMFVASLGAASLAGNVFAQESYLLRHVLN